MRGRIARWALVAFAVGLCCGLPVSAEFYKYTDKSGRTVYVDEIRKIPAEYQNQVGRYAEKFDHLPATRRARQRNPTWNISGPSNSRTSGRPRSSSGNCASAKISNASTRPKSTGKTS